MTDSRNHRKYPDRARPEDVEMRQKHLESVLANAGFYSRQLGLDDITDLWKIFQQKLLRGFYLLWKNCMLMPKFWGKLR